MVNSRSALCEWESGSLASAIAELLIKWNPMTSALCICPTAVDSTGNRVLERRIGGTNNSCQQTTNSRRMQSRCRLFGCKQREQLNSKINILRTSEQTLVVVQT